MFLSGPRGRRVALCYSMNVHAGEGLTDVLAALEGTVAPLKSRLDVAGPFAVGLRLAARAAKEVEGRGEEVKAVLGVPERMVPVWLQLLGRSAESPEAGGQRPRRPFQELFSLGRWGTPYPRDTETVAALERDGLLQPPAPRPGRHEELARLAARFGYEGRSGHR